MSWGLPEPGPTARSPLQLLVVRPVEIEVPPSLAKLIERTLRLARGNQPPSLGHERPEAVRECVVVEVRDRVVQGVEPRDHLFQIRDETRLEVDRFKKLDRFVEQLHLLGASAAALPGVSVSPLQLLRRLHERPAFHPSGKVAGAHSG